MHKNLYPIHLLLKKKNDKFPWKCLFILNDESPNLFHFYLLLQICNLYMHYVGLLNSQIHTFEKEFFRFPVQITLYRCTFVYFWILF